MVQDLLTARQLQDLLQVDRTTIYHMLQEGRLPGFKVGGQWRFSRRQIEAWLDEQQLARPQSSGSGPSESAGCSDVLPVHCIQPIQNVFAQALEVGAVTTAPDGTPLTKLSNACSFCALIQSTTHGYRRCVGTWQRIGRRDIAYPRVARCHAGLSYAWGRVEVGGQVVAMVLAGQFRLQGEPQNADFIRRLATDCGLPAEELLKADLAVPVLSASQADKTFGLLRIMADSFAQIGQERLSLVNRLKRISEMSTF